MGLDERRQRPEGFDGQPCGPGGLAEHPWQPPGMDRDQGGWEQLQRAQGSCLLLAPLRCDLPACAKEDASIRARPLRDAVAPFVKLPAEVAQPQRAAENAGPARCAPFPAGGGGGRRHMVPCEAASHGLGGRRAQPYCRTVCAHVGIRGREAGPGDGASPERLEGGRGLGGASCGAVEPLVVAGLQPGQELDAPEGAQRNRHGALPMTLDVLAVACHGGARASPACAPGGDCGGRAGVQLRVETRGGAVAMPGEHEAGRARARRPVGQSVWIPGAAGAGSGRAGRHVVTPALGESRRTEPDGRRLPSSGVPPLG